MKYSSSKGGREGLGRVVVVLLVASAVVPWASAADATAADCVAYPGFATPRDAERCFFSNACYSNVLCCPSSSAGDDACLDITSFACDLESVCAEMSTGSTASHNASSLFIRPIRGGAAVECCSVDGGSTVKPNVPGYEARSSSSSSLSSSSLSSAGLGPVPQAPHCGDPFACNPNSAFARVVRTLCPSIPAVFDEAFLNSNLDSMCCWYETASSPAEKDWGCGADLLSLPETATYHCNIALRGTQHCCNGRVDYPLSARSPAREAAAAAAAGVTDSRATLVYTYLGSTCTDRILSPDGTGDAAPAPVMALGSRSLTVAHIVVIAVTLLLVFPVFTQ